MYIERVSEGKDKMADIKSIDAMWDDSPLNEEIYQSLRASE